MALGSANPLLLATAASGGDSDPVTRSLRFKDADNSQLYFDPTATHDSSTVYTFSCWAKLGEMDAESYEIFTAGYYVTGGADQNIIYFGHNADSKMRVWLRSTDDNTNTIYTSSAVFRDPAAWYHLTLVRNGASLKVYVNNTEVISETISSTQRYGVGNGYPMHIGSSIKPTSSSVSNYGSFDGLLADVYFTDGYAKAPTDFIEDAGYGAYKPKAYTGSFGTNGFHLKLDDSSDIGADDAGSNDFTAANLSSHDVMLDTPTKNYCLINPLAETKTGSSSYVANPTTGLSEGNLKLTSSQYFFNGHGTFGVSSGKWYFEWYSTGDWTQGGFTTHEMFSNYSQSLSNYWVLYNQDSSNNIAAYYKDGTSSSSQTWAGGSHASGNGNVFGCAFDVDNRKMYFHKNGEWSNGTTLTSTFPSSWGGDLTGSSHNIPADTTFFPIVRPWTNSTVIANFGQDSTFANTVASGSANAADANGNGDFRYTPPSGYLALCTANLDAPTVTPAENFEALTYSGSGSSRSITGLDFQPDLVWIKDRTTGGSGGFHCIHDSVRGDDGTHKYILSSDNTITTDTTYSGYGVTSFNSDGFSIINGGSLSNYSSRNYVAWNWKAHQSPSSGSGSTTTYTVKVEDNSDDAWDSGGSYYDESNFPTVYMELFENRNSSLVSLGSVAVRSYDDDGNDMSDYSEQTYTLECADLDAIAVKWHYDTSGDGDEYDYPYSYNDYLNDQKITILDGTTSEWTTNNHSNDDGTTENYSPPTGWADGDTLKAATTSYNGSDTATLTSDSGSSGPTEKYNAAAGFTIISYSGDGSSEGDTQTLDHSLGVPLEFVIVKARTSNDGYNDGDWVVYHKDLSSGDYLTLNSTSTSDTPYYNNDLIATSVSGSQHSVVVGNDTDSSSTGYLYLNSGPDNGTGEDYILYGWAGVEGYSKFGSYTGNGSADGAFINLGFRPAFFMLKRTDGSHGEWWMYDSKRDGYNVIPYLMQAEKDEAESSPNSSYYVDFVSNGVKLRNGTATCNGNGNDFIYAAFSESPLKYSNAR